MLRVTDKKLIEYYPHNKRRCGKKQGDGLAVGTEIGRSIVEFQGQAPSCIGSRLWHGPYGRSQPEEPVMEGAHSAPRLER